MPARTGIFAVALALAVAGCLQSGGAPVTPTEATEPPPRSGPAHEPTLEHATFRFPLGFHLGIWKIGENRTVHAHWSKEQARQHPYACYAGPGWGQYEDHMARYSVAIWNATGLVRHYYGPLHPTAADKSVDFRFDIPPGDPPFMIGLGATCLGAVMLTMPPSNWTWLEQGTGDATLPGAINQQAKSRLFVQVPAGATKGTGIFRLPTENMYHIWWAPTWSNVENRTGWQWGELRLYEPNQHPDTGQWISRSFLHPHDNWFEVHHGPALMPGDYRYVVELTAPALVDTVWEVRVDAHEFLPYLQTYGFQLPFRLYDDWTVR
jgi:hypothetical protein